MKYLSSALVLCGCLMMSMPAMAYTSADCTNVEQLASQGIVSYRATCREYNLDRTITRQEVAAVALKVGEVCGSISNIPPSGGYACDNIFTDVSSTYPNDWVCRVAETLARDGVVSQSDTNQYGDVFFRPLKNVTRAEALAMLLNGGNLEFQGVTYDDWRFTGTGAVSWQKPLMQYAYDRDIINSITSFGPNSNASRGDVFNYATAAINLCRGNQGNYNYNNNNYYNTQCGIGQYRSGNSCYSCNTPPANAYYATANTCAWTCQSGYYKSGNTCISNYNNNYYGANGQCGVAINTCISGNFQDTTDYGNYSYWNCAGSNGNTVSCSAYNSNNYYGTTGQCGNTINSCISGTFYDTVDYGNYAYWNCTGSNGTAVSCSAYNNNYNYNNCGVGQYYSGNMCLGCTTKPSTAYYTTNGTCDWTCQSGYYKSGNTCISNYNYGTTAQCSTIANSCISGYASNHSMVGNYSYWTCNGTNGTAVSCSAYNNNYYGTTGQCGSTQNTCTAGYVSGQYTSGNYSYWNCVGNNGNSVSCSTYNYNNNYNYSNTVCDRPITANAYYTNNSNCWSCNAGYTLVGDLCVWWYN